MFKRIAQSLWGKFDSKDELKKFMMLALTFGLVIGTYWALRPMKDSVFSALVGVDFQPYAKLLSLLIISPLVVLYTKLIDWFPRNVVFYVLTGVYGAAALFFAFKFMDPASGLANPTEDTANIIGWAWYVYVESFGSLVVALFWAFTTDITSPDSARRGFPLIALFGQLGNIVGPLLPKFGSPYFGNSGPVVAMCGVLMFLIGGMIWLFMKVVPASQLQGYESKDEKKVESHSEPGFFEGLKLMVTQPYLLGIFLIIFFYEIIVTVFDFHFKTSVKEAYGTESGMASFLADYGMYVGIVAMASVMLGINNIQRILGMTASLLLLPLLVGVAALTLWGNPTSLNIIFWIMVIAKAVNYALNQPTLKQLYIPTSKDAKYKAQAWIEMFGSRGSKGSASVVNTFRATMKEKYGAAAGAMKFIGLTSVLSFGVIGMWLFVSLFVARTYQKAVDQDKLVC